VQPLNAAIQTETKESKWEMPEEIVLQLEEIKDGPAGQPATSR
jgi:hypothetical protein